MSNNQYHALPALGSTGIKLLSQRPSLFKAKVIDGVSESKRCYDIGSAFHSLTLEPDKFEEEFAVSDLDRRTNAFKDFAKELAGQTIIKPADFDLVSDMRDGVLRNETAYKLLNQKSEAEMSYFWNDQVTDVECKCRPDALVNYGKQLIAVDLKSTQDASPEGFRKSVWNFRYDIQAAWYSMGISIVKKRPVDLFAFIVTEKTPPFDTAVYYLSDVALNTGLRDCKKALDTYKRCVEADSWPGLPEGLIEINLPVWANAA
jgi:hypothetical protein